MKKRWLFLLSAAVMLALLTLTALGSNEISLQYDDRKDLAQLLGVTVESVSISNEVVTSKAVGTQTADTNVLIYEDGTLYAVGTGTATLTVNGQDYSVTVSAAPISLFMIIGHSVGMGQEGNADESVLCEAGQVYSTYGRGASIDNTAGGLGWGAAVRADAELDAFAPNGGGNIGEGSAIAYEWNRITGEKVWVMNVALGGSCLNEWLPDALNHNPTYGQSSHFNNSVSVFRSAQTVVAGEIAAGHYTLGNMAVIQHTGANFSWYEGWTYEGFQADYEAIWNGYRQQLAMDMDGDGQTETVEALGFVPYWDVNSGKNYELDKPAGYYMSASDEYPGIFTVSQVYRSWLTDEDVVKNFPEIDYTTQTGVELVKPTSTLHTNKGGSSDNSVYCSKDYAHLSQVAYNAVGQDIAKNLYQYFRVGHAVDTLTFMETPTGTPVTQMQMSTGESVRLTCTTEPLYAEGVTFKVTDNLELSYPLCITATGGGNGAVYAYRGDTLLAQVDIEIINTHTHCVCGGSLAGHSCESEIWMPWGDTEGEKTTLPIESGNYYLVSDITLATTASIENQDVKLCLNGYKVESAVKTFWVGSNQYTGGSLTLTDCKDTGAVSTTVLDTNGGSLLRMRPNAESLNIYGGIYDATGLTEVSANGGLLYLTGGTTNIYGGSFKGGLLKDAGKHGSIGYVTGSSQVNVYGGTFLGGNCSKGGIFEMDNSNVTVNISGGTFTGGYASYGDMFNVANAATLNISGGDFTHKENNPDTLRSFNGGVITLTGGTFTDGLKLVIGGTSTGTLADVLGEGCQYFVNGKETETTAMSLSGRVVVAAPHIDHCVCTGNRSHTCDTGEWKPWASATALPSSSGKYYLVDDVTLNGAWDWSNKDIQLCLNGHTVTGKSSGQTIMLGVANNTDSTIVTKLAICDCQGGGVIQSASDNQGAVLRTRKDLYARVDFYSGTLKGIQTDHTQNGGAVSVTGGSMNMYGGTIYGGDGDDTKTNTGGGAVYICNNGSFTMYDGTVYGGKEYYRGGAVAVDSAEAVFTMYGGTVSGGTADYGNAFATAGNVYMYGGTIDCDITSGATLQIRENGAYHIAACSFPKGIVTQNCTLKQILVNGNCFVNAAGEFVSITDKQTALKEAVQVQEHTHCYCVTGTANGVGAHSCQSWQKWTKWTDAGALPTESGCYYLDTDVTLTGLVNYASDLDISICLNGHTVTGGGNEGVFKLGNTAKEGTYVNLSITDCTGSGSIVYTTDTVLSGGMVRTERDGNPVFNLYGGTLQVNGTMENGGVLYINGNGAAASANIYGGQIIGCTAKYGGAIYVAEIGTLNLYGGKISNGIATELGGNIACRGKLHMSGDVVVENGTAGSNGGNLYGFSTVKLDMTAGILTGGVAYSGGNLYLHNDEAVTIENVTFRNGSATGTRGGNIYLNTGKNLTLINCQLEGGTSKKEGGGVCALGTLTMTDCTLTQQTQQETASIGGAIYSEGVLTMEDTTVSGGRAVSGSGGSIAIYGGSATIKNCVIHAGIAGSGAALSQHNNSSVTLTDTTLYGNPMSNATCWLAGGTMTLSGNVVIADAELDLMLDLRSATPKLKVDTLNTQEPVTVQRQDGQAGVIAYAGDNTAAQNMLVPGNTSMCLCYEAGNLVLSGAVVYACNSTGMIRGYTSLQEALEDTDATWLQLAADLNGVTIGRDVLLDLNGHSITNVKIPAGVTFTGMDSATDDYEGSYGSISGTISGTVAPYTKTEAEKTGFANSYLAIPDGNGWSFHRYYAAITKVSLKPASVAVGYKAQFFGDQVVRNLVTGYGYNIRLNDGVPRKLTKDGVFANGDVLTLRVQNMLVSGNDSLNAIGSTAAVGGNAFITFRVGDKDITVNSSDNTVTLRQLVEAINEDANAYSEIQIKAVQELCTTYASWMHGWATENIFAWTGEQAASAAALQVGFGRVDITPDGSVPLSGYGNTSNRMSTDVLNQLYSTCIAFTDDQGETVLLFHNDLQINGNDMMLIYREQISAATGVKPENIHIAATHTHSAPDLSNTAEPGIVAYREILPGLLVQAAEAAMADRTPATMFVGSKECDGLNFIRHYLLEDGTYRGSNFGNRDVAAVDYACEVDSTMQLIRFDRENARSVVMMNWQMHPTQVGGANAYKLMVSSDVIGVIRDQLEQQEDCLFAYFTGASGNVSYRSEIDEYPKDYLDHGQKLANHASGLLDTMTQVQDGPIRNETEIYTGTVNHSEDRLVSVAEIYYKHWTTNNEWDSVAAEALAYGINSGYHAGRILSRSKLAATDDLIISAFSIGDVAFTISPYEMFSQTGSNIKDNSPFAMTFVVTCADGDESYMPTQEAFAYNSYESNMCKYVSGVAEELEAVYMQMLQKLSEES